MQTKIYSDRIETPFGLLTVLCDDSAVRAVLWESEPEHPLARQAVYAPSRPLVRRAISQLHEYLAGQRKRFDLPLCPRGTDFQQKAWRALQEIPYGTTVCYQEQAKRLGRSKASRAVGAANGRNPIPIIIPCHRVVGKNGSLTGYAGGTQIKRWLLDLERGHAGTPN